MRNFALLSSLVVFSLAGAEPGFLHRQGAQIVDAAGHSVTLRGTNLGNWLVPEGYMFLFENGPESGREIDAFFRDIAGPDQTDRFWREWRDRYITEHDIAALAHMGMNLIRLPMHHSLLAEGGEGWRHLDDTIAWARKHGLWVILDLHAAPAGQTGTNIDDSWGYPWLFESEKAQADTVALWKRIAARYHSEPAVLGYDLLNEPIPPFNGLPRLNPKLEPLYRRIVAAIREVDTRHIVILEGPQWASTFAPFSPPFDDNVMYSFHKYWTAATREVIQPYLDFRAKYNAPIYMGESGENTDDWIAKFAHVLDEEKIPWTFWPYKKMEKTSAIVTFRKPQHWDAIVEYSRKLGSVGTAEKKGAQRPTPEQAQAALRDLLDAIAFDHGRVNSGYVRALGMTPPPQP
jgi:endoglucanase